MLENILSTDHNPYSTNIIVARLINSCARVYWIHLSFGHYHFNQKETTSFWLVTFKNPILRIKNFACGQKKWLKKIPRFLLRRLNLNVMSAWKCPNFLQYFSAKKDTFFVMFVIQNFTSNVQFVEETWETSSVWLLKKFLKQQEQHLILQVS